MLLSCAHSAKLAAPTPTDTHASFTLLSTSRCHCTERVCVLAARREWASASRGARLQRHTAGVRSRHLGAVFGGGSYRRVAAHGREKHRSLRTHDVSARSRGSRGSVTQAHEPACAPARAAVARAPRRRPAQARTPAHAPRVRPRRSRARSYATKRPPSARRLRRLCSK